VTHGNSKMGNISHTYPGRPSSQANPVYSGHLSASLEDRNTRRAIGSLCVTCVQHASSSREILLILDVELVPRVHWQSTFSSVTFVYSMHDTQPTPISVSAKSPAFDKLSFVKYVKDIGKQYRKQAMKLVSISRTFAQAQEHTRSSYNELRR